jgi:hypothetical protein
MTKLNSNVTFDKHPHQWRHPNWGRLQLRYFEDVCKIRREKNIEDFIITNGIKKVHVIKDNTILDQFFIDNKIEIVDPSLAELIIITDQRFSRLSATNMIQQLNNLIDSCSTIYFCLNKYYLNANESIIDNTLPENYDVAIVKWFEKNLNNTIILNRTEQFIEDGSCFTWVVPSSEILICKK